MVSGPLYGAAKRFPAFLILIVSQSYNLSKASVQHFPLLLLRTILESDDSLARASYTEARIGAVCHLAPPSRSHDLHRAILLWGYRGQGRAGSGLRVCRAEYRECHDGGKVSRLPS